MLAGGCRNARESPPAHPFLKTYLLNHSDRLWVMGIDLFFLKNPLRFIIIILLMIPILFYKEFIHRFYLYLTGNIISIVVVQQWQIVIVSSALFLALLIPLSFRRKANWIERGLYSAFIVSLFVEMYGIPLTIMVASNFLLSSDAVLPVDLFVFEFLGTTLAMDLGMTYGALLVSIGIGFIITGWLTLYNNRNRGLVTQGIYNLSRHPQNLGIILVIFGWLMAWPSFLTLLFSPILIWRYVTLSRKEEEEIIQDYPSYREYRLKTPFLI